VDHLAKIIKQHRIAMRLTLRGLATVSGISSSHLGRIERRERFPSAHILRRIAEPLGFDEGELFSIAGFLSPVPTEETKNRKEGTVAGLDPYVAKLLGKEPLEVQRSAIGILTILKSIAKNMGRENL